MVAARRVVAISVATVAVSVFGSHASATCLLPAQSTAVGAHRPITPTDLVRLRDIGSPDPTLTDLPSPLALSPDGRTVAFVLSQADPATNLYCRWLMVAEIKPDAVPQILDQGGELITMQDDNRGLLTQIGLAATVTPAWSPDGRSIGYLRRDHGITQLWVANARGGGARPVTSSPVDIERWAWISDDQVVVASRPGQIDESRRVDAEGRSGWHYDARFSPQISARPQLSGDLPVQMRRLDVRTGAMSAAGDADAALIGGDESGSALADLGIVSRAGARAWVKTEDPSPLSPARLRFSDGGHGEIRCGADTCAGGIVELYWSEDQHSVVFLRREGWDNSEVAFYRWYPSDKPPTRLWSTSEVLLGCLPRDARFVCLREASSEPRRIVEVDPSNGTETTIYDPNPEFAALELGSVERLTWRNKLGLPAWGDLVLPPNHRTGEALPMVVVQYHSYGFLRGGTGDEYPIFPLAARGFAVLSLETPPHIAHAFPQLKTWDEVNRAGNTDWALRRSILSSTLTGVAQVVARGFADPKRIGITGLSDGATSARFALINSRVVACAAISSSSIEPKTMMTYGGIAWADENRQQGYPPASQEADAYWRPMSMALNAATTDTPLLIQASDDEYLLALETFTALREHDKPIDMYVFPDEHHVKWQPAHRLAVYQRDIDWFAFWLQGVVDPAPAKAAQLARWEAMRTRLAAPARGSPAASAP